MNPVSHARFLATMSTTKLAKQLGVSKQYLSRLEQGIYDAPNQTILKWAADELNKNSTKRLTTSNVEALYRDWQWGQRETTKANRILKPVAVTHYDRVSQKARTGNENVIYYHIIFGQWLESYFDSVHQFCVAMCLHPSPVAEYIEGRTHSMPNKLRDVLVKLELLGEGFKTNER